MHRDLSFSVFLNITDHQGNDVSHKFNGHHQHKSGGQALAKRAHHNINCGPDTFSSECLRGKSPRAYRCLDGHESMGVRTVIGACPDHQLCIDSAPHNGWPTAFCADLEGYVKIAQTLGEVIKRSHQSGSKAYTGPTGAARKTSGVEAVFLTAADNPLPMQEISIEAVGRKSGKYVPELGIKRCTNCYALPFLGAPAGTTSFIVRASLFPESPGGELYIDTLINYFLN
jgi:hypothetical protein